MLNTQPIAEGIQQLVKELRLSSYCLDSVLALLATLRNEYQLDETYSSRRDYNPGKVSMNFFRSKMDHPPPLTATGINASVADILVEDGWYYNPPAYLHSSEWGTFFIQGTHTIRASDEKGTDKKVISFERNGGSVDSNYECNGVHYSMTRIPSRLRIAGTLVAAKKAKFTFHICPYAVLTDSEGNVRKYGDGRLEISDPILWISSTNTDYVNNHSETRMLFHFHGKLTGS